MAGKLGIVGMHVDSLSESTEADQQNADQPQSSDGPFFQRFVKNFYQSRMPRIHRYVESGMRGRDGRVARREGSWHLAVGSWHLAFST